MQKKHKRDEQLPATADAYAPPPAGTRTKRIMWTVVAIVAVCVVVVLVAVSLG